MLTQLELKNWRSVREAILHFTPLTVFVGANSSGKSNILDTLHFLRDIAVDNRRGYYKYFEQPGQIQTLGLQNAQTEIAVTFKVNDMVTTYRLSMDVDVDAARILKRRETLSRGDTAYLATAGNGKFELRDKNGALETEESSELGLSAFGRSSRYPIIQQAFQFITQRWQLLSENFMPPTRVFSDVSFDPTVIDECAINTANLLQRLKMGHPALYELFVEDMRHLLPHIVELDTGHLEQETRYLIREARGASEAPTISAGTSRLVAMLTAYHALAMRDATLPGLVVIEEPDTALHPLLLQNFVELLRDYTSDPEHPRQFILTTHNPRFLDYFEPEEVRVVERDDAGETHIEHVSDDIREIWLEEHSLGNAWLSRIMGGIPNQ